MTILLCHVDEHPEEDVHDSKLQWKYETLRVVYCYWPWHQSKQCCLFCSGSARDLRKRQEKPECRVAYWTEAASCSNFSSIDPNLLYTYSLISTLLPIPAYYTHLIIPQTPGIREPPPFAIWHLILIRTNLIKPCTNRALRLLAWAFGFLTSGMDEFTELEWLFVR